jgi:hypothetical protein
MTKFVPLNYKGGGVHQEPFPTCPFDCPEEMVQRALDTGLYERAGKEKVAENRTFLPSWTGSPPPDWVSKTETPGPPPESPGPGGTPESPPSPPAQAPVPAPPDPDSVPSAESRRRRE